MKTRPHLIQNISLKWSFALYVTSCLLIALMLSAGLGSCTSLLQDQLNEKYQALYGEEIYRRGSILVDGQVIQEGTILIGIQSLTDYFNSQDLFLYRFCDWATTFGVPLIFIICIVSSSLLFYRRKLKHPLQLLDDAAQRIARNDLDFSISTGGRNELDRLAQSFERMRAALEQNNRALWRTMEERRQINAAFSHDLRTPMTILRGYNDFLLRYYPAGRLSEDKILATLHTMDHHIARLERYIQSMSSIQRLEEREPAPLPVDLSVLVEHLEYSGKMLCRDRAFSLSCRDSGNFTVDSAFLSEVFENLVSNAVRYCTSSVQVSLSLQKDRLVLTVCDDGHGFSQDALSHAADAYYREEKEARDSEHFGLGLHIARVLCEKHGGYLQAANRPGGGAQVTAFFPALHS